MYLAPQTQSEVRATLDVAFELANALNAGDPAFDARNYLAKAGFSRASEAPEASIKRLAHRVADLHPLLESLPEAEVDDSIRRVNEELTELPISPWIADHGGVGPHLHWTPTTATFDNQVMSDILMALAHELCDNGTIRVGRCGADDCDDLFYDGTRNRSRRFCSDPRCASRTHTADHRARNRSGS